MECNRREFLTGCLSTLSILSLPISMPEENTEASLPDSIEAVSQSIVRINGTAFRYRKIEEVFEHDDYYLHIEIAATEWENAVSFNIQTLGCIHSVSIANSCIEVSQDTVEYHYTGEYTGYRYYAGEPEQYVTLFFRLESLVETSSNMRMFTNYSVNLKWRRDRIRIGV